MFLGMEFELETIHLIALACAAVVILYSDHKGYAYMTGKVDVLTETFVRRSHMLVWIGLFAMILSGVLLVIPTWIYRLQEPAFYVKMALVLILVWNGMAIGKLARVASVKPFRDLPSADQRTLMLSGGLSVAGWVGATVIGFFFL